MAINRKLKLAGMLVTGFALIAVMSTRVYSADAADAEARGRALYAQSDCATCHGASGKGDGAAAAGFPEDHKPRDFTAGKFKFGGDDKSIQETISQGRPPYMPPHPQFNPKQLADLSAYVRSCAKK